MNKEQLDEFYHLLRCASNDAASGGLPDLCTGLTPLEEQGVLFGICGHLLGGGDYPALIRFSQYYGQRFLVEPVCASIKATEWNFDRVVDFGSGLQWFGRALAAKLGYLPTLFVDKRPWPLTDIVADLETLEGRKKVLDALKPNDLIVMSDLLHCLNDPKEVMSSFSSWPKAILEYCPVDKLRRQSFNSQLARYGGSPVYPESYMGMFPRAEMIDIIELDPYMLLLVGAE